MRHTRTFYQFFFCGTHKDRPILNISHTHNTRAGKIVHEDGAHRQRSKAQDICHTCAYLALNQIRVRIVRAALNEEGYYIPTSETGIEKNIQMRTVHPAGILNQHQKKGEKK